MGVGAAEDGGVPNSAVGQAQIVEVLAASGDEPGILPPRDGGADVGLRRGGVVVHGILLLQRGPASERSGGYGNPEFLPGGMDG